jgi:hypothetical protein
MSSSATFQNAGSPPIGGEVTSAQTTPVLFRESAEIMDKATIELLAQRAGLEKAMAEFPEDVAAAAEQASGSVARMKAPTDPLAEPWPPMKAGTGL